MKPMLWLSSSQKILNILSSFLAKILSNPELLSNKVKEWFVTDALKKISLFDDIDQFEDLYFMPFKTKKKIMP